MSVANCKSICREVEEAEYGDNLSASVMEHLRGCGQCQKFYDERLKLRQLVASLETVTAPADFDLRVRYRIANERVGLRTGFWPSNLIFSFPSLALASLILVLGGVFAVRMWNTPATVAVQAGVPKPIEPRSEREQTRSTEQGIRPNTDNQELRTAKRDDREVIQRQPKKRSPVRSTVASVKSSGGLATMEFSTTPPRVIRKEEAVASLDSSPIFSIETSSQPLRLSLDYSGGISRTISVPALSFGSERVITGANFPSANNSAKGAW